MKTYPLPKVWESEEEANKSWEDGIMNASLGDFDVVVEPVVPPEGWDPIEEAKDADPNVRDGCARYKLLEKFVDDKLSFADDNFGCLLFLKLGDDDMLLLFVLATLESFFDDEVDSLDSFFSFLSTYS